MTGEVPCRLSELDFGWLLRTPIPSALAVKMADPIAVRHTRNDDPMVSHVGSDAEVRLASY